MKGGLGDQKLERRATELAERTGVLMAKAVAIMRQEQPQGAAKARSFEMTSLPRAAMRSPARSRQASFRPGTARQSTPRPPTVERELIRKRARAGMAAAKRRGKHVGRPRALTDAQVRHGMTMVKSGRQSISGMANLYRGDRKTIERALKRAGSAGGNANA